MVRKWVGLLPMLGILSACTTLPLGPSVLVLPGVGKPFDQFQVDNAVCQQYAYQQTGLTSGQAATESTVSGAVIGTAVGAAAGAAIGAAAGSPGTGAAVGAGAGLLMGTAAGSEAGAVSGHTAQWRYDMAYVQCMYAKGNQVPGVVSSPRPPYAPPPPPHMPPPPPTYMPPPGPLPR